jgi:carbon storage regulator CsrA
MLVFKRKEDEKVRIGDDIIITITKVDSVLKTVKIGIEAPEGTRILRDNAKSLKKRFKRKLTF